MNDKMWADLVGQLIGFVGMMVFALAIRFSPIWENQEEREKRLSQRK